MTDLTEDDVHAMREQDDLKAYIRDACTAATNEAARIRRAVLARPDLAQQLTEPPLSCPTPEAWTGYIPPSHWHGSHNDSPIRTQLLALLTQAETRQTRTAA